MNNKDEEPQKNKEKHQKTTRIYLLQKLKSREVRTSGTQRNMIEYTYFRKSKKTSKLKTELVKLVKDKERKKLFRMLRDVASSMTLVSLFL